MKQQLSRSLPATTPQGPVQTFPQQKPQPVSRFVKGGGVKIRGTGAATKGTKYNGPMV